MTRHEFLTQLHDLLKPKKYLEVGVQYGKSLNLAIHSQLAIGIDPHPLCQSHGNQQIFSVTSDDFFTYYMAPEDWFDLAFIDGSHLFEDALRDFINIEEHSHSRTVVVFDDVLPYTQEMSTRTMQPGHWTGDVWKIHPILNTWRPDLQLQLVDTSPTGTMVAWNVHPNHMTLPAVYQEVVDQFLLQGQVPASVLGRTEAAAPEAALSRLRDWVYGSVNS